MPLIAVDARMLKTGGISTYIHNLVPLVIRRYSGERIMLFGKREELAQYPWAVETPNVSWIDCRAPIYSLSEQWELYRKIPPATDLFWSPHYNIPLFFKGPLLVTIHGINHLMMPEMNRGIHRSLYAKAVFRAIGRKADAILCVSDFIREHLNRHIGPRTDSIYTTHLGVDDAWFHVERKKRPYDFPYILFVGHVKPHKNLGRLLAAFESVMDKIPHRLVILGRTDGFITGDDAALAKARALPDRVTFGGYLDGDALRQVYAHADLLILPSLNESFGLPLVEAMAVGTPVIAANVTGMPEACGDAALYCNPLRIDDIAQKIVALLTDQALRIKLTQKGLDRARRFSWATCSAKTCEVIGEILQRRRTSNRRPNGSAV